MKSIVSEGMLKAALAAAPGLCGKSVSLESGIEAVLRWQSEHAKLPTADEMRALEANVRRRMGILYDARHYLCMEWVRTMYAAPQSKPVDDLCRSCSHCTAVLRGEEEMEAHLNRWHPGADNLDNAALVQAVKHATFGFTISRRDADVMIDVINLNVKPREGS